MYPIDVLVFTNSVLNQAGEWVPNTNLMTYQYMWLHLNCGVFFEEHFNLIEPFIAQKLSKW